MINAVKDDISKKASAYMTKCGVPNKLHSQMIFKVCDIIYKNKDSTEANFKPLLSSVNILNNSVWASALKIIFTYLKENHLDLTLSTIKIEEPQIQDKTLEKNENVYEKIDDLIKKSNSKKDFNELVQSFLSTQPLKCPIDITQELYPDVISSESLGQDLSNFVSDNSLNIDSFHDD